MEEFLNSSIELKNILFILCGGFIGSILAAAFGLKKDWNSDISVLIFTICILVWAYLS